MHAVISFYRSRYQALDPRLQAAVNAAVDMEEHHRTTPALLEPLVQAMSAKNRALSNGAVDLLQALAYKLPDIHLTVKSLLAHQHAHVRFNAVCCITSEYSRGLAADLLSCGLRDKSGTVRLKSANIARLLRLKQLVPQMEQLVKQGKPSPANSELEYELCLLRDEYHVRPLDDGGASVTIALDRGSSTRLFTADELRRRGILGVVADTRDDRYE